MEKNLLSLIECGRVSPGIVPIRSNPMSKTLHQFINYLNSQLSNAKLSNINTYILIRSFWALPRVGCTYKQGNDDTVNALQGTCRLIDVLLGKIIESQSTLTPKEWSIIVKSIGKLRYNGGSEVMNQILGNIWCMFSKLSRWSSKVLSILYIIRDNWRCMGFITNVYRSKSIIFFQFLHSHRQ